jgi:hypothetical protein
MKVQELFEASGREKAAVKMGKSQGDSGKPAFSKAQVEKSFGSDVWDAYIVAYNDAKKAYQAKDDHDAWKEKIAAKRQGRNYHE